jgi:putative endopeptidase
VRRWPPASQGEGEQRDAAPAAQAASHGIDPSAIDASVAPGDDFFLHANGAWLKNTAIPADRSSYGVWSVLFDRAQQRTRELLEKAAAGGAAAGSDERKIGDYYATYLDEQAIRAESLDPLRESLRAIDALADKRALATWIGGQLRADVDPLNMTNFYTDRLFGVWVAQNLNDPSRNVPYLLQGGSGCPTATTTCSAARGWMRSARRTAPHRQGADAGRTRQGRRSRRRDLRSRTAHRQHARHAHRIGRRPPGEQPVVARRVRTPRAGLDWDALLAGARLDRASTIIVWHPVAFRASPRSCSRCRWTRGATT